MAPCTVPVMCRRPTGPQESGVEIYPELRMHFLDLHHIITALKAGNITPALE